MILSAYERKDSPFVHVQYADATGKKRYVKTGIRKTDPDKELRIAKALNAIEAQVLNSNALTSGESWEWVPKWLSVKYHSQQSTLDTYRRQWKSVALFLRLHGLKEPGTVSRAHCFDYTTWRTTQKKLRNESQKTRSINTAIGELKLLGMILDEAMARGFIAENVARKLGIEREESAQKPPISDSELAIIFAALKSRPVWMQRSFFLGLNTGVRFAETRLDRHDVSKAHNQIVIEKPKGGRKKAFAIPIYPEIAPVIDKWLETDDRFLWDLPPEEMTLASLKWTAFFREIKLPHLCFHCTRVTFITRGAIDGVPESIMMKMVNHASVEVHRIYQRLADQGALPFRAKISIPSYVDAIA